MQMLYTSKTAHRATTARISSRCFAWVWKAAARTHPISLHPHPGPWPLPRLRRISTRRATARTTPRSRYFLRYWGYQRIPPTGAFCPPQSAFPRRRSPASRAPAAIVTPVFENCGKPLRVPAKSALPLIVWFYRPNTGTLSVRYPLTYRYRRQWPLSGFDT